MPDDLRTRIAAVIRREVPCHPPAADRIADAVIAELNLNKQFGCPTAGHHHCHCSHRYTTPWKDNE